MKSMKDMNKRALLIAFHFPPQAASSGIQRTLSFSKNLGAYGWDPLVLSAHPMAYNEKNPTQLASIPASVVVKRPFALDTKRHLGYKGRYLEALALPDRWASWWLSAVPSGLGLIRKYKPEVIWSTFPIATSHLIGLTLHRITGLPWIADFRDPMLQPSYPTSVPQRKAFQWIEQQTIQRCTHAVFTTHSAMEAYKSRFPEALHHKFSVIENGYDEDGFDVGGAAPPPTAPGGPITLLHSGVLYQSGRSPDPFLAAVAALKKRGSASAANLNVILRAPGSIPDIEAMVRKHDVGDIVQVLPPVPYREALQEMLAADGLMIFQGTPFNTQIPAKIYEYFRARKPILGLVDPQGETARVLCAAGFSDVADMDDAAVIAPMLADFTDNIRAGSPIIASDELVASSSRKHRAGQLAERFNAAATHG